MTDTPVIAAADLAVGEARRVEIDGLAVCLAHAEDGEFYAVADRCTHEESELSSGWCSGTEIECPLHNAMFDLRTGEATALPAIEPVATYRVTVTDGNVFIDVGRAATADV
jgi:3-phenylpropionate/trans-cinnamate dioxygenase ferredoxin subunit